MFYNQKNKLEWLLNLYLLSSGINVPHFRLLKHIAWILKLKRVYNGKIENVKHVNVSFEKLDQTDAEETETEVYKYCQLESFGEVLRLTL